MEEFQVAAGVPKDGQRPRLGELVSFEIETDKGGKKRAKTVSRPARANAPRVCHREPARSRQKRSRLAQIVPLVVLVALGVYGYDKYSRRSSTHAAANAIESAPNSSPSADQGSSAGFRCDGRTHCSQMTSCAEATFFLRNCPDVQMDGNHDGVPCEQQWCT
ncbi:MAG TPA: excalibur calcium-binding domain-containing protein, partial [Thiobacillus sp.]|nr:excalibur calcium-binding domain-containing protein [Thiobacillus sp.]